MTPANLRLARETVARGISQLDQWKMEDMCKVDRLHAAHARELERQAAVQTDKGWAAKMLARLFRPRAMTAKEVAVFRAGGGLSCRPEGAFLPDPPKAGS